MKDKKCEYCKEKATVTIYKENLCKKHYDGIYGNINEPLKQKQ